LDELNKVALEGIGAARQASPLLEVERGVETAAFDGAGAAAGVGEAGAGVGAAGVVATGVVAVGGGDVGFAAGAADVESLEDPLDPQPLSAAIKNRSASLLNALNAFELFPMPPVPV
jgi:hypothetical protein